MRQLRHALTHFELRASAAAMLVEQRGDQNALQEHHAGYRGNLLGICFPYGEFAISNFAAGRQIVLTDTPASHLPPVENGPKGIADGDRNVRWAFAREDA